MLINNRLFYIHIPRTAGRYISYLFLKNKFKCEYHQFNNKYADPLKKLIEVPHLEYPYYTPLYQHRSIPKFTVIRNPVDRFISMLSCTKPTEEDLDIIFRSQVSLNEFINKKITDTQSNWFVPQCKFVSHDTHLWVYENKLKEDFFKWIAGNFEVFFDETDVDYDRLDYDFYDKITLSEKQKDYVKNYYYQDYKIFNNELIT